MSNRKANWVVPAALVLLVALLYARTGGFAWLNFDDGEYVFANPNVLAGLTAAGFRWAFTAFHSANWHPLTWLSHMADVQLFGPSPGVHHIVNAALHAANAVLLFLVLARATASRWKSAVVAALFAVHPLNVESVAWISQRKSVLSTLFLLLAMGAYLRWTRKRTAGGAALVAALLVLGLLAKPMLVTAPLLFLALDFWPLGRFGREKIRGLLLEKIPLFLAAAAVGVTTVLAQAKWEAVAPAGKFPLPERIANGLVSAVLYLRDAVWPADLACFYPHPATLGESVGLWRALGAAAILAVITAWAVATRRSRPWLLFGWTWYLVALLPVIGIVQVGSQARADRYMYVPLIGIFAAAVWEIASRLESWERSAEGRRILAASVAALAVGGLAIAAWRQVGDWRNEETLYGRALAVTHRNWLAANNLGTYWLARDEPARALPQFEEAIRMRPEYEQAWFNQGVALLRLKREPEAVRVFRRNLELEPGNTDGWVNLGLTYLDLGRVPEAVRAYETALEQRPQDPLALSGAAFARAYLGEAAVATAYLERLERADPARAASLRRDFASRFGIGVR